MAENNLNDGVGRKIVEALMMQSSEPEVKEEDVLSESTQEEIAEEPVYEAPESDFSQNIQEEPIVYEEPSEPVVEAVEPPADIMPEPQIQPQIQPQTQPSALQQKITSQLQFQAAVQAQPQSVIDNAFNQSLSQNLGINYAQNDDFNYPANVAVLKQLIAKLPAGVSKQTGALIIKQTMEALGISMGGVLQEAKQVQETLIANAKEYQNNIVEYRKQIGILEAKAQQSQNQAAVMNDIINLFIQTGR